MLLSVLLDLTLNQIFKITTLFTVTVVINELLLVYVSPRYAGLIWAVMCLWILVDSMLVSVQLTQAEMFIKEKNLEIMELRARNRMLHSDKYEKIEDIRHRIVILGKFIKDACCVGRKKMVRCSSDRSMSLGGESWSPEGSQEWDSESMHAGRQQPAAIRESRRKCVVYNSYEI
jgi:hypothetical protein